MKNSLLDKQIKEAKINFNYFFMVMIVKIIKQIILLTTILLINQVFDILIINIITLLFTICSIFIIYKIAEHYNYILNDIKNTFSTVDFTYIVDTYFIKESLLKKVVKYGK